MSHMNLTTWLRLALGLSLVGCAFFEDSEQDYSSATSPLNHVIPQTPVHRLRGAPNVDASGSASYEIPLEVPPGRRGMAPELSLRYSSGAGEGHFGQGFDLVGAGSRVHRCQKTIDTDGAVSAVQFDSRDRLCVDGMRLVGAVEDEAYWLNGARYHEETSAWRRIQRHETPEAPEGQFVATSRDGRRHVYGGGSATVRALRGDRDENGTLVAPETVVVEWRLSRVEDPYGNYIDFQYAHDDHPDGSYEHYLTSIRYTGAPNDAPLREVRLVYSDSGIRDTAFSAGVARRLSRVVERIEMWVRESRVRSYIFDYKSDDWTRRQTMVGARECDQFDLCREKTVFEWSTPAWYPHVEPVMVADSSWLPRGGVDDGPPPHMALGTDVNGDGRDDLVYVRGGGDWDEVFARLSTPSGFSDPELVHRIRLVNAITPYIVPAPSGGRGTDFLLRTTDPTQGNNYIWRLASRTPGGHWVTRSENTFGCTDWSGTTGTTPPIVADFIGDGAAHAVWDCASPSATFSWRMSKFEPEHHWAGATFPRDVVEISTTTVAERPDARSVVDLDGDGRTEVLAVTPEGSVVPLPSGTPSADLPPVFIDEEEEFIFADLNGDGLEDRVTIEEGAISTRWNTGRGFGPRVEVFVPPATAWGNSFQYLAPQDVRVADFDRDGLPDLLLMLSEYPARGRAVVLRSTRSALVAFELPLTPYVHGVDPDGGPYLGLVNTHVTLLDHDGDGQPGFTQLRVHSDNVVLEVVEPSINARPAALVRVVDGHLNPEFQYADLSEARLSQPLDSAHPQPQRVCGVDEETGEYECVDLSGQPECESSYPVQCIEKGVWVARSWSVDDGVGGRDERTRRYSAARMDVRRGVGLGFARTQLVSFRHGEVVDTELDLSQYDTLDENGDVVDRRFPFAGQIRHETTFRWPDGEISEAVWPPTSARVVARRVEYERRLQRASIDSLGDGVHAYRALLRSEEERIFEAASWKSGQELRSTDLIHHWRTTHQHDRWGTTVYTSFEDLLGETSTLAVSSVSNHIDDHLIGRIDRRTVWSAESVFSEGRSTAYVYVRTADGIHELRSVVLDEGAPEERLIELAYDPYGNRDGFVESGANPDVSPGEVETLERTLQLDFDEVEHAFVTTSTNGLGHVTKYEHVHETGRVASITDPNDVTQHWYYDGYGVLVGHVHQGSVDQTTTSASLDACYMRTSMLQGRPAVDTLFDCLDRPIRVVERWANGTRVEVAFVYDNRGNLVRQSLPHFVSSASHEMEYDYDGLGRLTRRTHPDGSAHTRTHYRRSTTEHNSLSGRTVTTFDTMGRVASINELDSISTKYFYGAFGRLIATDRGGFSTSYQYSSRGYLEKVVDPNRGERTYVHNAFGEVERTETVDGIRDFDYDALGRLTLIAEPDGSIAKFDYDSAPRGIGRISSASRDADISVVTKYAYDLYGRPNAVTTDVDGREVSVRTEHDGRLLDGIQYDIGDTDSVRVAYEYDTDGRPERVSATAPASGWQEQLWEVTARHDPLGRATEVERGFHVQRTYDPMSGRTESYEATLGSTLLEAHTYAYDFGHYLTADIDSISVESFVYEYDKQGRLDLHRTLAGAEITDYDYDDLGNQTLGSNGLREFDDTARPNILTSVNGVSFAHDDLGRRTETSAGWRADYNAFDLPRWIQETNGRVTAYGYDAFQTRVSTRTESVELIQVGPVRQIYDDSSLKETAIAVTVEGERIAEIVTDGETLRVRWLSDSPTGTSQLALENGSVNRHARPDAFGGLTGGGEPWSQFGGRHYKLKSPLVDSGARIYDPDNAVFLSPDPVRATAGHAANPYQYAFQNPNSYIDPTGRWPEPRRDCLSAGCGVIGIDVRLSWDGTHELPLMVDPTARPPGVTSGIGHGVGGGEHVPGRTTGVAAIEPSLTIANFVNSRGGTTDAIVSAGAGMARDFISGINSRGRASVLGVELPPTDGAGLAADGVAQFFGNVATVHDSNASGFSRILAGAQIGLSVWSSTATVRSLVGEASEIAGGVVRGVRSDAGGIIESFENASGGTNVLADGPVRGADFWGFINAALMRGRNVNIISGTHGDTLGRLEFDQALYLEDLAKFGSMDGVRVFDAATMSATEIRALLLSADTTIGAFCNSGVCLRPFL